MFLKAKKLPIRPPILSFVFPRVIAIYSIYDRLRGNVSRQVADFYLFYLLVSPYYNTQNYHKNKNNIQDYIGRVTATA
jgi:hypothetical protein